LLWPGLARRATYLAGYPVDLFDYDAEDKYLRAIDA
jgi:hypothetical protein